MPRLIALDIMGGPGNGGNYGLNVASSQVFGGTATNSITVVAGSLGTGGNEYGINIAGTVQGGDGCTITLNGTGGGLYSTEMSALPSTAA